MAKQDQQQMGGSPEQLNKLLQGVLETLNQVEKDFKEQSSTTPPQKGSDGRKT